MNWVKARIQIKDILLYLTLFYFTSSHLVDMVNWVIFFLGANDTFQDSGPASVFQQ